MLFLLLLFWLPNLCQCICGKDQIKSAEETESYNQMWQQKHLTALLLLVDAEKVDIFKTLFLFFCAFFVCLFSLFRRKVSDHKDKKKKRKDEQSVGDCKNL